MTETTLRVVAGGQGRDASIEGCEPAWQRELGSAYASLALALFPSALEILGAAPVAAGHPPNAQA